MSLLGCPGAVFRRAAAQRSFLARFCSRGQLRFLSGEVLAADASFTGGRSRSCGIVGMPNVGKSTLFNGLTNTQQAQAANYPFCTIEPNVGKVAIPDQRLETLATLAESKSVIGAQLEFVDIAGLVRGASEGAGLGNQFLANIRQVSVIVQLLRCYDDTENTIITHVDGSVDPVRDFETIETELLLADIQTLSKKVGSKKRGTKDLSQEQNLASRILDELDKGIPARELMLREDEVPIFRQFQLLTAKPLMILCNVGESELHGNQHTEAVEQMVKARSGSELQLLKVSCKLEEEVSQLGEDEESKKEMLQAYGQNETGLHKIIEKTNKLLGLQTFYTVGPKEARAWSFVAGTKAPQAAGIIHSDLERGFIKAETVSYEDFVECGGEAGSKEQGKLRLEGKEYVCQDGDIFHFKFNV